MRCIAGLLLFAAACAQTPDTPPSQPVKNAAAAPPPAPAPAPRAEHPLDRIPTAQSPNDPWRFPPIRPVLVHSVPARYTEVARKARLQGDVILELLIERDGRVSNAKVLKSLPMALDMSALTAVREWRYTPGKDRNGAPVRTLWNVTVPFRL
ncbi:MAG: hypothetical protein DMF56_02875 [Acidobacteria bacterium]|nr:MAG: hypothetical protein DMF56_02875 [Acidobacteriota bacterium]